jgi:hypothetical protein
MNRYYKLLNDLHRLIDQGGGDSDKADVVREEMLGLRDNMTDQGREDAKTMSVNMKLLERDVDDERFRVGGIYQHFRSGNNYRVIALARHSETLDNLVVYSQLYGLGDVWTRPLEMFLESVEHEGEKVYRFDLISKI